MSLMLYGQGEPEPVPDEPAERPKRRYLIILGMVVVLILAGGSAAYLLLNSGLGGNSHASGPDLPPVADSPTVEPSDSAGATPSDSASASASASASHSVPPSRGPSGKASVPPGGPAAGAYRVASGDLCTSMDFAAIEAVGGPGTKGGDHTDKSTYTDFSCQGSFGDTGHVKMTANAFVFTSPAAAAASYASDKTGTDHVTGVGTDATGSLPTAGGYVLIAYDGNLEFKIRLIGVGGQPNPARLRDVAIDTIRNSLPKLH
jgi:hypothetical protein